MTETKKPTFFVDITGQSGHNPLAFALEAVAELFGFEPVDQLVRNEVEADFAITDSVAIALRMVKETETSKVIVAHLMKDERAAAEAFASRYSDRVTAVPMVVAREGEPSIVPYLLKVMAERKEA